MSVYNNISENIVAKKICSLGYSIMTIGYPDIMIIEDNEIVGFVEVKPDSKKELTYAQIVFKKFCDSHLIPFYVLNPDSEIPFSRSKNDINQEIEIKILNNLENLRKSTKVDKYILVSIDDGLEHKQRTIAKLVADKFIDNVSRSTVYKHIVSLSIEGKLILEGKNRKCMNIKLTEKGLMCARQYYDDNKIDAELDIYLHRHLPITTLNIKQFNCKKCGSYWNARDCFRNKFCPKCRTPFWNTEKVNILDNSKSIFLEDYDPSVESDSFAEDEQNISEDNSSH